MVILLHFFYFELKNRTELNVKMIDLENIPIQYEMVWSRI